MNRIDPSGHSWLDDAAKALKKAGNAIGTAVKKAANTVVDTAKKVVTKVKEVASDAWDAITHPKETIQKVQKVVKETKQKADNFVQEVKKDPVGTFNKIKTKATTKIEEIKSEVKRAACTSAEYIKEGLGKVDWASVGKAAAGVAIVAGLGVASVMTGGAAAVILGAAFTGAAIGAVAGGISGMMSGEGFFAGAADGLLTGSITGAITGAAGQVIGLLGNKLVQNGLESVVETVVDTADTALHGGEINAGTIATSFALNLVTNGINSPNNLVDETADFAKNKNTKEVLEDISKSDSLSTNLTDKELSKLRQKAVRDAWKMEKNLVEKTGQGSRNWSPEEIDELLTRGKVTGYEGQHMKSAKRYPEYAGDPNNIQFLKGRNMDINEHLDVHMGNYQNPTNWYYDPETGVYIDFGDYVPH